MARHEHQISPGREAIVHQGLPWPVISRGILWRLPGSKGCTEVAVSLPQQGVPTPEVIAAIAKLPFLKPAATEIQAEVLRLPSSARMNGRG